MPSGVATFSARRTRPMSTRKMLRVFYHPWYRRPFAWLLCLIAVAAVGRLALTPFLAAKARRNLEASPLYAASFDKMRVFLFPPVMVLEKVQVRDRAASNHAGSQPALVADRVEVHLTWAQVMRPDRTVRVRVRAPIVTAGSGGVQWGEVLSAVPGARIELMSIEAGQVRDAQGRTIFGEVEATVKGLSTLQTEQPAPMQVEARGMFLGSGRVVGRFRVERSAGVPTIEGTTEVRDLAVGDLESLGGADGAARGKGALDVVGRFVVRDGVLKGSVQSAPMSAQTESVPDELAARFASAFSGVVPAVVATSTVEGALTGSVTPPQIDETDAMVGVVRAVVVAGVQVGLHALMPVVNEVMATEAVPSSTP